jgi:ribonuclease VapC
MVIDTSAIIACLSSESDAPLFHAALMDAEACVMSALTFYECRVVLSARFPAAMLRELDLLMATLDVRVVPFDAEQAILAHDAYRRLGRGTGHPAQLNFADCAAYALARDLDDALLFKADDFTRTDVRAALAP